MLMVDKQSFQGKPAPAKVHADMDKELERISEPRAT